MKNIDTVVFFLITFLAFSQSLIAQKGKYFILEGKIANVNNGIVRLSFYDLEKWKYDSAFREKLYPYLNEIRRADFKFFASHPNSIITGFYLMPYLSELPLDTLQKIYSRFNDTMRSTIYGKELKRQVEILERSNIGQVASAFCGANFFDNARICLENFKGKYIILDFWASWCIPCRQSTPYLIDLFNRYKTRGLVIIGIASEDGHLKAWEQAIRKDGTDIWYNIVSGIKESKNGQVDISASVNDKFGVQSLPAKILIDSDGIIIGRYIGTNEEGKLDEKLDEIFR